MVREIQGPNNQPPKLPGVGQGGVRSGYEGHKGGGGQSGKKAPEPEPETPEEEADEEGHLDADSFARKRYGGSSENFLADARMPWEVAADERRQRLAELKQKRTGATGPLAQAKAAPKGLPPRHGLGTPPGPAAKPAGRPASPPPAARRPEAAWDPDAAASSTLNAYQQLRERQETRERPAAKDESAAEERGGILASGPSLNRDAISAARRAEAAAGEPEPAAPAGPSWLVDPADIPEVALPKAPPAARRPEAPAPAPSAPKLRTGPLSAPAEPARPASTRGTPTAPPRREPAARGPLAPPEPEAETAARIVPAAAPEPEPGDDDAYEPPTPPSELLLDDLLADEPLLQDLLAQAQAQPAPPAPAPAPPPAVKPNSRLVCRFQILDAATKKPLAGARLEFEPVQDDRLPVVNGQANFEGWYEGEGIPPGHYQVTVRAPGYIPQMQTCYIKAGELDEGVVQLKKP